MMLRRGLVALLLGAVATLFESSSAFLLPTGGPRSRSVVGPVSGREQHHQPLTAMVPPAAGRRRGRMSGPLRMSAEAEAEAGKVEEEMQMIKPMKIKEIKAELDERGVGYQDLLEKAEFMRRLAEARVKGITKPAADEAAAAGAAAGGGGGAEGPQASASAGTGGGSTSSGPSASSSSTSTSAGAEEAAKQQQQPQQEKKAAGGPADEAARMAKALEEIMKMRVSEMKKELDLLKVPHAGLMEKREFAEALAKARMAPGNQGSAVDPDDDPSEYRTVKVTRMPKGDDKGPGSGSAGGGGPGAGRAGPGARGPGGMGGDPFSDIFNQAGGARGARGGAGGAGAAGAGGFGSSFFDAINNGGFGGMGGNPFGGAGGGMGGFDPSIIHKVMSNPRAAAAFQRAQSNPRIMAAVQEMARNPSAMNKYMNDPEIASVLKELQSVFR